MRLEYDVSAAVANPYAYRVVVSPVVRVESETPLTVDEWVKTWVQPVRRIASLATGQSQPLTYLAVRRRGERRAPYRGQVYGTGITQSPYQSDDSEVRKDSTALYLAADNMSLLNLVRDWQRLEASRHPLIETYGAMLHAADEHPRSRFLLLVQALEGMHGHETSAAYADRTVRHTEKRELLIAAIELEVDLTSDLRRFLRNNLTKKPARGLDAALRGMVTDLPTDLMPKLDASALVREVLSSDERLNDTSSALARVRNDLAHGNRGYDAYDIDAVVKILERVVRAHAMRLLGCPEEVLVRILDTNR